MKFLTIAAFIACLRFLSLSSHAQPLSIGVKMEAGSSYTNFINLNKTFSSNGLGRLDDFSYSRGVCLMLGFGELNAKGGISISDYLSLDNSMGQYMRYTNFVYHGMLIKKLVDKKNFSLSFGLGGAFSNSTFIYVSGGNKVYFLPTNMNGYYYMHRDNSAGFRGEFNADVNLYRSQSMNHQIYIGVNTSYVHFFNKAKWTTIDGYPINDVPDVWDNNFYLNLAFGYNYYL